MFDLLESEVSEWISRAKFAGCSCVLIVRDIEDKSYFPVFFFDESDAKRYRDNIISESKIEIVKSISLFT
jgi:hypothetical protein